MDYTLDMICDWSDPENIAIEYHNSKTIERINYSDLKDTIKKIQSVLTTAESFGFIGINFDLKPYCVPSLILGIQAQGYGFINLPATRNREICSKLEIEYIFSSQMILDTDLICELNIHEEIVKLLKCRNMIISEEKKSIKKKFAYAVTTSGSTGEPKIVKVPHSCIVPNVIDLKEILGLSKADKIAQITALTFDPSIVEIFLGLSSGGTLIFVSNDIMNNANKLLRLIFEHKVTFLQTTPSLWRCRWSDDEIKNTIFSKESSLKVLLIGGEPFPKLKTLGRVKHPENKTRIYNVYGITEVSCWAGINEINLTNSDELNTKAEQNLGKPLSQTTFQVRNQSGDIVRNGEGILYIGSDSRVCEIDNEEYAGSQTIVFRNTGDLAMIQGDTIFYKGRCDRTVKRFGNRLDLTELEAVVLKLNFVQNCFALWDEQTHKLYLCVSTVHPSSIEDKFTNDLRGQEELKHQLRELPSYYQPDRIKYLNNFKLNANGKICRKSLMRLFKNTEERCSENSNDKDILENVAGEEILTQLWGNYLTLSPHCGFLDNGGTSVIAIQISNELSIAMHREFPELIGLLLKNKTLNTCIEYVTKKVLCLRGDEDIGNSTSNLNDSRVRITRKRKYNFRYPEKALKLDTCVWQKCRGTVTGEFPNIESLQGLIKSKLTIEYTRDLKKCVDASPTIFRYSSGEIYVSVGSHAGVILTRHLNHLDSTIYEVTLPDRIEASILALSEFNGIVGCYDGYVYYLNLKSGQIIWKFKTGDVVKCTAVLSDDGKSVFVGSYDKYLYSISIKDGSEVWKSKESEGSISATPRTFSKSHSVVFGTLDGTCVLLDQCSGQIIWKNKFQDPIFSAPGILENGNVIFCSVSGEVNCFDFETGRKIWEYKIGGNVFSHLVIRKNPAGDTEDLIIGCNNRNVYCLAVQSSSPTPFLRYSVSFEYPIFATPYCEGDILIVAETSGNINLLRVSNGEIIKNLKLNGDIFSSPIIAEGFLVVGCRDNNVYIVRIFD